MGTIFTALAEDSTQGTSCVQKQGARDLPWAVSRCLGFHRARCGGTSLRSLGTQEPLPCGGCAAGRKHGEVSGMGHVPVGVFSRKKALEIVPLLPYLGFKDQVILETYCGRMPVKGRRQGG